MKINVLQELEDWGVKVFKVSGEFASILCPFHKDTTPSMTVKLTGDQVGRSQCFACSVAVNFPQLLHKINSDAGENQKAKFKDPNAISYYLAEKYDLIGATPIIPPQTVDKYCLNLEEDSYLVTELNKRAVSYQKAQDFHLGCDGSRITIPIYNQIGECVNVVKYLPGCKEGQKFYGVNGQGKPSIYPFSQIQDYDKIILAGGLIKALACTGLNDRGIGAVSLTHGEKPVPENLLNLFRYKEVYVVYDIDEVGKTNAERAAESIFEVCKEVKIIELPFTTEKGGVDDFIAQFGLDSLHQIIEDTKPWKPEISNSSEPMKVLECTLTEAIRPENVGRRVRVPVKVTGTCTSPYYIPKLYRVSCGKDAKPDGLCNLCPMYVRDMPYEKTFEDEAKVSLSIIDKAEDELTKALKKEAKIPSRCTSVSFKVLDYRMLEDIRVSPMLNLEEAEGEREDQIAICYSKVDANSSYYMEGRIFPHPDSQKATMVCSKAIPLSDDISNWELTTDLSVLSTSSYEEILLWLERNVTRIYNRPELHAAIDLIYHTPLMLRFNGELSPGWGQALILGDAGQGKTKTSKQYSEFLGIGTRVDCKNASVAGLLGGCSTINGSRKQFIRWGFIPANDRKLVILEELGGASVEVLAKLTDMRSEGIAQIPKIESKSTKARTRLIAISTPRTGRPLNTYSYGSEAIYELMGAPADIRRFDIAVCLKAASSKDAPDPSIPDPSIQLNQEILRASVLFAWTRSTDQIIFSDEVTKHILSESDKLLQEYEEDRIPLLNRGAIRFKIAKLSAALAMRLYSVDPEDREKVIVKIEHVDWIVRFLDNLYRGDDIGYHAYCKTVRELNHIHKPEYLLQEMSAAAFKEDLIYGLSQESIYQVQDIMDWGGLNRDQASALLSAMRRCRAVIRRGKYGYIKTPGMSDFLSRIKVTNNGLTLDGGS